MYTPKQQILAVVTDQPEDSSFDEIVHEILFTRMINHGLEDVKAGRVISHEDLLREVASWCKDAPGASDTPAS